MTWTFAGSRVGVAVEDVGPHAVGHRDDGVGGLVGRLLRPAGQAVPATELLGLPRAARLERVRRHHMRDAVQQLRYVAGKVRVPGVGMNEVDVATGGRHRQVDRQGGQRGVGPGDVGRGLMPGGAWAVVAEGVDVDVDQLAQLAHQVIDVDAGAAVDVGRELSGEDRGTHA